MECARKIRLNHGVPIILRHAGEQSIASDTGIIYEDIDLFEFLEQLSRGRGHRWPVGNIHGTGDGGSTGGVDGISHSTTTGGIPGDTDELHAFSGEIFGNGLANSPACAGDQGGAISKCHTNPNIAELFGDVARRKFASTGESLGGCELSSTPAPGTQTSLVMLPLPLRPPSSFFYIVAIGLIGLSPGCRDRTTLVQQANASNTLLLANGTEPADLDPQIVTGSPESALVLALFEGLVRYDPVTLDPLPGVAESWELAEDDVTYTFHLRADAKWSDGVPVTAHDFVSSSERILAPEIASENSEALYFMAGATDFNQGRSADFSTVGCRAIDDRTLEIRAARPTPFLLRMMSARTWFPNLSMCSSNTGECIAKALSGLDWRTS